MSSVERPCRQSTWETWLSGKVSSSVRTCPSACHGRLVSRPTSQPSGALPWSRSNLMLRILDAPLRDAYVDPSGLGGSAPGSRSSPSPSYPPPPDADDWTRGARRLSCGRLLGSLSLAQVSGGARPLQGEEEKRKRTRRWVQALSKAGPDAGSIRQPQVRPARKRRCCARGAPGGRPRPGGGRPRRSCDARGAPSGAPCARSGSSRGRTAGTRCSRSG